MMLFCMYTTHAQETQHDVTTFLGIPVDGYKSEMRKKLIAKGFAAVPGQDYLKGEFNGTNVTVSIVTNNNKVYRIMLYDAKTQDVGNIKIRFNNLISQFKNNKRYLCLKDYTLDEKEDISYEMLVHNKIYDAYFYQVPNMDSATLENDIKKSVLEKYTMEEYENPTKEIKDDIEEISYKVFLNKLDKKIVWFRIIKQHGEYGIAMYYDNIYNEANGEDL